MFTRINIINLFIEKYKYNSYLEIGTQYSTSTFNHITAKYKVSIEPYPKDEVSFIGTSDEYFNYIDDSIKFDIIFIDGLHLNEQVTKDIENSLKHLNDNGTIICHDCLPESEKKQRREYQCGGWFGDVWKAFAKLRIERDDLELYVINTDCGCGVIRKGTNILFPNLDELTWEFYQTNYIKLMNIISVNNFITNL